MPEHRRKAAIVDSQAALRFMLANGPSGKNHAHKVYVAGDSAGGNLTLMLSAWARDEKLQPITGIIAFSPSTDSTATNPSMRANIKTDPMLGPGLGPIARLPAPIRSLLVLVAGQLSPRNPLMSPLFGDLSRFASARQRVRNPSAIGDRMTGLRAPASHRRRSCG